MRIRVTTSMLAGLMAGSIAIVGGLGVADAATGGALVLGHKNHESRTTTLSNSGSGAALKLRSQDGTPPLSVAGNTTKVPDLNADLLDGLSVGSLQARVSGTCPSGQAVTAVKADGSVLCADTGPVVWQGNYNADGSPQAQHPGLSVTRTGTGAYHLTWTGFPGYATPYIQSLNSAVTVNGITSLADGTGSAGFTTSGGDNIFWIALIQGPE